MPSRRTFIRLSQALSLLCVLLLLTTVVRAQTGPGTSGTTTGTWRSTAALMENFFQGGQAANSIGSQRARDLLQSVSPLYQVYPDTPQRPMIGDFRGSPVGAVAQIPCPVGAVMLNPTQTLSSTVSGSASPSTFCFTPGLYRAQTITPRAGDVYIGLPGAVMNGAVLLTAWSGSGPYTIASPQGSGASNPDGSVCNGGAANCNIVQGTSPGTAIDVYYDGVPLFAVGGTPAAGQFNYNSGSGVLTIANNPAGHIVESSNLPRAFTLDVSNVTIENLVITKYGSRYQDGCVAGAAHNASDTAVTGITLSYIEVSLCHGYGVRFAYTASVLQNSYIHDNGEMGIGGGSSSNAGPYINGLLITNNEISYNNYAHYACGNECGGVKMANGNSIWVVGNHVHHNLGGLPGNADGSPSSDDGGYGLWCDIDCLHIVYSYNWIHDHHGPGIQIEEGCYFQVNNNIMYQDNTTNTSQEEWAGEIMLPASHHGEVAYNTLGGPFGIKIPYQARTDPGQNCGNPHPVGSTFIHDNQITCQSTSGTNGGQCVGGQVDGGAGGVGQFSTVVFWNNHYGIQSCCGNNDFSWFTNYSSSGNVEMTFATWKNLQDNAGPPAWAWASNLPQFPAFPYP